jgi:hypothetical protein
VGSLTATPVVRSRRDRFIFSESAPIVLVFTKYDRLVRTKKAELKEDNEDMGVDMSQAELKKRSSEAAEKALESYVSSKSVKAAMEDISYARVSSMVSHFFFDQY